MNDDILRDAGSGVPLEPTAGGDTLARLLRAGADAEATAAAAEFPYSPAVVGRFVRDIRRRRFAAGAVAVAASVAVVGGTALGVTRPWQPMEPAELSVGDPTPTPGSSPTPAVTPTPAGVPTATPTPTPTLIPTPTATPTREVTEAAPEATTPPLPPVQLPPPPGAVTVTYVGEAGGSGEVMIAWEPVPGATAYRVYRSEGPDGPFVPAARYDVATGATTVEYTGSYEYITVWAPNVADYDDIQYVEAAAGAPVYLSVAALNAGGEGPASAAQCGEPPGFSGPGC